MHLVSRRAQTVEIGGERFTFQEGEAIHTENSHKYTIPQFQALARTAGYEPHAVWTDAAALVLRASLRCDAVIGDHARRASSRELPRLKSPKPQPFGTFFSRSSSQVRALPSEGARQSPRGESEPPATTFGPFGSAERLNWLMPKKRLMKTSSQCRIVARS